jgi:hypothetical protein
MSKSSRKIVLLVGVVWPLWVVAGGPSQQAVYWPRELVENTDNLRINEIRLSMDCAEFRGLRNIPSDWNVEVIRPISGKSEMHLSAGHGASDLHSLKELDGAILLGEQESDCFSLSATVITEDNEIKLNGSKFKLVSVGGGR